MELITSAQNGQLKQLGKLIQSRRERSQTGLMVLDGTHLVAAWLDAGHALSLLVLSQSAQASAEIVQLAQRADCRTLLVPDALFAKLSDLPSATGILALTAIPTNPAELSRGFVLALDGVQDPGNVGAILRTAYAAGVEQVWLSAQCADIWSPKVLRAGMGAQAVLPCVTQADLPALVGAFDGSKVATLLDLGARDLYGNDYRGSVLLMMGSEGAGLSAGLAGLATHKVLIPMQAGIESLNVGHATAICLYEMRRQRAWAGVYA